MTLNEYQEQARRTASNADGKEELPLKYRSAMRGLGIAGEAGEVAKALRNHSEFGDKTLVDMLGARKALVKEAGDTIWYCAMTYDVLGIKLADAVAVLPVLAHPSSGFDLMLAASDVADLVKKIAFHDHSLESNMLDLVSKVGIVVCALSSIMAAAGISWDEACTANIEKLRLRFKDGFSTEESIRRRDKP